MFPSNPRCCRVRYGVHSTLLTGIMAVLLGLILAQATLAQTVTPRAPKIQEQPIPPRKSVTPVPGKLTPVPERLEGSIVLPEGNDTDYRDALRRELVRQAFALSTREEFGMIVRDEVLGETAPVGLPDDRVIRIEQPHKRDFIAWTIAVGRGPDGAVIWNNEIPGNEVIKIFDQFMPVIEAQEKASRGLYVDCLKAARFTPRAVKRSETPVPDDIEELLGEVRETALSTAVRQTHAEIRKNGESEALTAGLVRGYGHLALVTEQLWSDMPEVFKARSLHYAQRLVARSPKSAWAFRHRAYALTCIGRHDLALTDLAAAETLAKENPEPNRATPEWLPALDAFLHFDIDRLAAARAKYDRPIIRLLEYIVVEEPQARLLTTRAGFEFVKDHPECYRVLDGLCRTRMLGTFGRASTHWLSTFTETMPVRIAEQPELPKLIRDTLANQNVEETELYASLRKAGLDDRSDLSWAVLGKLFQDIRFLGTWWRLYFLAHTLGVETKDNADALLPGLAGHPLVPLIESYRYDHLREPTKVAEKLTSPAAHRLDASSVFLGRRLNLVQVGGRDKWYDWTWGRRGLTFGDLRRVNDDTDKEYWADVGSPHSPDRQVLQVLRDKKLTTEHLTDIESRYSRFPAVQESLAIRHTKDGRNSDAVRCQVRRVELSPDGTAYRKLAEIYLAQGQEAEWLRTMLESLEADDHGLSHARTRVDIARHFMTKKEFDKAEPYADAAADSYAAWALECAIDCKLGLKKWEEADALLQGRTGRYPATCFDWYMTARKYSALDRTPARAAVKEFLEGISGPLPSGYSFWTGRYHTLEGRPKEAIAALRVSYDARPYIQGGLFIALLADRLDDDKLRDATMIQTAAIPAGQDYDFLRPMIGSLRTWSEKDEIPDEKLIEAMLSGLPANQRADTAFFLGWYLANRKATDRAIKLWTVCKDTEEGSGWLKTHAIGFLEEQDKTKK